MSIEALEGVTDEELFSDTQLDEGAEPEIIEEQEQPRDEQGKFAKVEDEPEPEAPQVTEPDDDKGQIPAWRLREVAEERRAAQAERDALKAERDELRQCVASFQKPEQKAEQPAKPDPLLDPDGYEAYLEQRFEAKQINQARDFDLRLTRQSKPEVFDKAYAEAQQVMRSGSPEAAELQHRMNSTATPGEVLLNWYTARETAREVGNDPNAYFQRKLDAWLSDPANQATVMQRARGQASTANAGRPAVSLPPSLTRATNASADMNADDDDVSDEGLFRHATR